MTLLPFSKMVTPVRVLHQTKTQMMKKRQLTWAKKKSVVPCHKEPGEPISENSLSTFLGKVVQSVLAFTPSPNQGVAALPKKMVEDSSSEDEEIVAQGRKKIPKKWAMTVLP